MGPRARSALLLVALWVSAISARPGAARAYVRMTAEGPGARPLAWAQSCVPLVPALRPPPGLLLTDVQQALGNAARNWNQPTAACSALSLLPSAPADRAARPDDVNVVAFLTDRWGRGAVDYDPSALAVTIVTYQSSAGAPGDGTIGDADIELNAVDVYFARIDPDNPNAVQIPQDSQATRLADLENTLTHELGHVLGLEHTCWDHKTGSPPRDDRGQPIVDCQGSRLPPAVLRTAMFPYAADGETSKRTISRDEVRGVCEPYPVGAPLAPCEQGIDGGCRAAPERGAGAGGGGVLLLFLAVFGYRKLRTRSR